MLDFVAKVFRGCVNVLLWLILIGFVIGGFIAGGNFLGRWGFNYGYAFLGLIIGGLVGLITVIFGGGLIANFLNMVDNIEDLKNRSPRTGSSSGINLSDTTPFAKPVQGETWTCAKCNQENPAAAASCKGCGEYK